METQEIPADVVKWVSIHFASSERELALAALRGAVIHTGEPAGPRLLRCVVIASRANLERLNRLIADLRKDYRDVIMAGEYGIVNGKLSRLRDLSQPIP